MPSSVNLGECILKTRITRGLNSPRSHEESRVPLPLSLGDSAGDQNQLPSQSSEDRQKLRVPLPLSSPDLTVDPSGSPSPPQGADSQQAKSKAQVHEGLMPISEGCKIYVLGSDSDADEKCATGHCEHGRGKMRRRL